MRFTSNEDALITELRIQGLSTPQIARFVRATIGTTRSAVTIGQRLKALAAAEEREADAGYSQSIYRGGSLSHDF